MDHGKFEMSDEKIKLAFKHLDFDDSGYIERREITKLMGTDNEAVVDYILAIVDTDKDGKISFEEFKSLMIQESFNSRSFAPSASRDRQNARASDDAQISTVVSACAQHHGQPS